MDFIVLSLLKTGLVAFVFLTALAYLQWIERKVIAHVQVRVGPNRVGPHGLLQPLTDTIKLLTKEDLIPSHVNKFFYLLAPIIGVSMALISISVIPFGPEIEIPFTGIKTYLGLTDLNIGVLVPLACSGIGVYAVALAGWSSTNKYALLGGLRASAQMISYELPMALSIAAPLLMYNTLDMRKIVEQQGAIKFGFVYSWGIFSYLGLPFVAFILFLICAFAETNRIPFDLPEAENELVAGFHTEYSSMKFASFFMAEYANMTTICCLATVLFLGGWYPPVEFPGVNYIPGLVFVFSGLMMLYHGTVNLVRARDKYTLPAFGIIFCGIGLAHFVPFLMPILVPLFWFLSKVLFLLFLYIWVRATLPRFRYDQLMHFAWGWMFPVSIGVLFATALLVAVWK